MGTDSNSQVIEALRKLLDSVRDPGVDDWDPIELGLLISKLEYADLDLAQQRAVFSEMAASVTRSVNNPALKLGDLKSKTQHIAKIFSQELGFAGDKTNYYNIKNSFVKLVRITLVGLLVLLASHWMGRDRLPLIQYGRFLIQHLHSMRENCLIHSLRVVSLQ